MRDNIIGFFKTKIYKSPVYKKKAVKITAEVLIQLVMIFQIVAMLVFFPSLWFCIKFLNLQALYYLLISSFVIIICWYIYTILTLIKEA